MNKLMNLLATGLLFLVVVSCSSSNSLQRQANAPQIKISSGMAMVGDANIDSAGGVILMKGDVVIPKNSKNGHMDIQIEHPTKPLYRTSAELLYKAGIERGPFAARKRTYALKLPTSVGHDTIIKLAYHDTDRTNNWETCREPMPE